MTGGPDRLRVLCVGMGAIGTYFGGSLALIGEDVSFIERPEAAARLNQNGLHIQKKGKEYTIPNPRMFTSYEAAFKKNKYDLAIVAVKSFDTQGIIEEIIPYQQVFPPVLCLQNGVENEMAFAQALGKERVIAGTVTTAVGRIDVGKIIVEKLRGIGIAGGHHLSSILLETFVRAELNPVLFQNDDAMKWSKMLTNLTGNASSAILNMSPGDIFNHPRLFRMEIEQLREALRVMKALSIPVTNLPGTPVVLFSLIVKFLPAIISRPLLKKSIGSGRGNKMPSFHIDLHSGKGKTEVEFLNGAVARFGKQKGLMTPVNEMLNKTLQSITSGQMAIEKFDQNPDRLLALM